MTLIIELTPSEEARLEAAARQEGIGPSELAKKLVTEHLPPLPNIQPGVDEENAAAIALLQSWLEAEATDDPEEIREAKQELEEFKQNLNANRAATGERLLFPE